jgi:myosin-5
MNIKKVWFKLNNDWLVGELYPTNNEQTTIYYEGVYYNVTIYYPYNELKYEDITDIVNLPLLDEPSILESIHKRFNINDIYTNCGEILISVNPFRFTNLYTPDQQSLYKNNLKNKIYTSSHIYNNANKSFYYLSKFNKNQSILISGESGAGKTQSTKIIIDYLTYLSSNNGASAITNADIKSKIIHSSPILESFGNAKTIKNNNSSRFGKYIKLFFNNSYNICGGTIETFLLEKIRVINQNNNERNFHIFYEFLSGSDEETLEKLKINKYYNHEDSYLNNGLLEKCTPSNDGATHGCPDKSQFEYLRGLLTNIGLDENDKMNIWNIIAFIIIIGGYNYELNLDKLQFTASLLNIDITTLMEALYTRRIIVNNESIHSDQNETEFYNSRNSLVTKLYSKLFEYIVTIVNADISNNNTEYNSNPFIGILDIFGFESLEFNSFEQLCINYANETLQHQFNKYSIEQEQKEYELEGITWNYVEFNDNIECINLIGGNMSIFKILDEQCKVPSGNDNTFLNRINKEFINNKYYRSNYLQNDTVFSVNHYAGKIDYNIKDFCEKNKDIATNEIMNIVNGYKLFNKTRLKDTSRDSSRDTSRDTSKDSSKDTSRDASLSRIGSKTISTQFMVQMKDLMNIIDKTGIHYVRCFKPNDCDSPTEFNRIKILEQLQNNGILETIKVSRHSFPIKYNYDEFEKNYYMICNVNNVKATKTILDISTDSYQFGKTKIFLKSTAFNIMEEKKDNRIQELVIVLQRNIRRYVCLVSYQHKRWNSLIIQTRLRQFLSKCKVVSIRRELKSIILQKNIRRIKCYNLYRTKRRSNTIIVNFFRKCIENTKNRSAMIIWRLFKKYKKSKVSHIVKIQSTTRKHLLRRKYKIQLIGMKKLQKIIRRKLFSTSLLKTKICHLQTKFDELQCEYDKLQNELHDEFNNTVESDLKYTLLIKEKDIELENKDVIIKGLETSVSDSINIVTMKDKMTIKLNSIIEELNIKLEEKNKEYNVENNSDIKLQKGKPKLDNLKKKLFDTEINIHKLKEDNNSYVSCLKQNIERRLEVQVSLDRSQDENKYLRAILDRHGIHDEYVLL